MRIPLSVAVTLIALLASTVAFPSTGNAQSITVTPASCALGVLPADTNTTADNATVDISRLGTTGTYGLGACRQPIELQCPANSTCDLTARLDEPMPANVKLSMNWHHGSVTYAGSCRPYQIGDIVAVFAVGTHPGITTSDSFLYRIRGNTGTCISTVPPGVALWVVAFRGAPPGIYSRTVTYTFSIVSTP